MSIVHPHVQAQTHPTASHSAPGPWLTLFLPALLGDAETSRSAARDISGFTPRQQASVTVIRARAAAALGDPAGCARLLQRAMREKAPQAASLAVHLAPRGLERGDALLASHLPDGDAADLAADLAAHLLLAGRVEEAQERVRRGLLACPDHGELGRWRRFLTQTPPTMAVKAAQLHADGRTPGPDTLGHLLEQAKAEGGSEVQVTWERLAGDVAALIPTAHTGWLPPERITRRILNGAWDHPARLGTGLHRIQEAGCSHHHFLGEDDLAALSPIHRLVEMEIVADRVESLLEEGRPATATATWLWNEARDLPLWLAEHGACMLADAAGDHPALADLALKAVHSVLKRGLRHTVTPERTAGLKARRACLLATLGRKEEARCQARTLLSQAPELPEALVEDLQTLLLVGPARQAPTDVSWLPGRPLALSA